MSRRQTCRLATLFLMVTMSIFISCVLPDDPRDAKNTKVNAVFMTTDNIVYEHSVVDTAEKALKIGAAIFLPENFDSVRLTIKSDSIVLADTVFKGYTPTQSPIRSGKRSFFLFRV